MKDSRVFINGLFKGLAADLGAKAGLMIWEYLPRFNYCAYPIIRSKYHKKCFPISACCY